MTAAYFTRTEVQPHCPIGALRSIKTFGRNRPHILIADDRSANRAICSAYCDLFDFGAETVCDGQEALEAARRTRFDVILMDIDMPRMNGIEAARAIRALPGPAGDTPIIGVTALVRPEDETRHLANGFWSVVAKPFSASRLFAAINDALWAVGPESRSWAPRSLAS
jgi:CheY-like chemotaxis protein